MKAKNTLIERAKITIEFDGIPELNLTKDQKDWRNRMLKELNNYLHSKKFMREIYTDYGREIAKFDL